MSSIKVSSFHKKPDYSNVKIVFIPDFKGSECSNIDTDSENDIPLSHLASKTTGNVQCNIQTESESEFEDSDSDYDQPLANSCNTNSQNGLPQDQS